MGLGLKSTICGVHSYSTVFDVWQPCDWLGPNEKGLGAASVGLSLVLCRVLKDHLFLSCLWIDPPCYHGHQSVEVS